jgi:hypothetical protein
MTLNDNLSHQEWVDVYKKLIYWELELEKLEDAGMHEILTLQKAEANVQFCKFVERNYLGWIKTPERAYQHRRSCLKRRCSLSWMARAGFLYTDR